MNMTRRGLEPTVFGFLTTLCYHSRKKRCSLDYVFTISYLTQVRSVQSLGIYSINILIQHEVVFLFFPLKVSV